MTMPLSLVVAAGLLAASGANASELDGTWLRDDGNARVRIAPCGDNICATNLWIGDTSKGEAVGDKLVMTLSRQADGTFSGTAYDAKRDWKYSMTITATDNELKTQGCVLGGVVCRNVNWKAAR